MCCELNIHFEMKIKIHRKEAKVKTKKKQNPVAFIGNCPEISAHLINLEHLLLFKAETDFSSVAKGQMTKIGLKQRKKIRF